MIKLSQFSVAVEEFRSWQAKRVRRFESDIIVGKRRDDVERSDRFLETFDFGSDSRSDWTTFLIRSYLAYWISLFFQENLGINGSSLSTLLGSDCGDWSSIAENRGENLSPLENRIQKSLRDQRSELSGRNIDFWGNLYQNLFPKSIRRQNGEFFTPPWLADRLAKRTNELFDEKASGRIVPNVLDPACGSGSFLLATIRFWKSREIAPETILSNLVGFDLNPTSVLATRANVFWELTRDLTDSERSRFISFLTKKSIETNACPIPIYLCDSVRDEFGFSTDAEKADRPSRRFGKTFDVILGNPPWICWDQLSESYRRAAKPLWLQYGLFDLSGKEARYGGGKKELASLMFYRCVDLFLQNEGILGMVVPQSLFQTRKAGRGFRRFELSSDFSEYLRLIEIDDLSEIRPFPEVQSRVATLLVQKNQKTTFPVPYFVWRKKSNDSQNIDRFVEKKWAEPSDFSDPKSAFRIFDVRKSSSFLDVREDFSIKSGAKTSQKTDDANQNPYKAQLGANSGGANGVFWLGTIEIVSENRLKATNLGEVGKRKVPIVETELESELIFPLLRWKDLAEFCAIPSSFVLIPQDPQTRRGLSQQIMSQKFPSSLKYLEIFQSALLKRAAYQKYQSGTEFWSMYNVDARTFSPFKVVWRRMDKRIRAAVVSTDDVLHKPIVPQETISMIAVDSLDEAHYLAAVLNSEPIRRQVEATSVPGSKGFGSPGVLASLSLEKFDPRNPKHRDLSQFGFEQWTQNNPAAQLNDEYRSRAAKADSR